MQKTKRILLIGGGSGGHIVPNLAIASELKKKHPQPKLLYICSRSSLDLQLLKNSGLTFKPIFTGKLRRYFDWQNFIDPFSLLIGFFQSFFIIIRFWPHVVFAKGGFVSVPVALAAFILRRPIVLHESDSRMGLSNRIIAKMATKICTAFPDVIAERSKEIMTGNPIRSSVQNGIAERGYQITGLKPGRPVLLFWGGSQGSTEINVHAEAAFEHLKSHFQFIHVTGHGKRSTIESPYYSQFEYITDDLRHIYAITDIVVGRAGANSLYELALMKKPNVLVPLRSAANNHQQYNAEYFEEKGASLILRDQPLHELIEALWHNREQYESMQRALSALARPYAADDIAKLILSI